MIQKFLDYITIEKHYSNRTIEAYRDDLYELCAFLKVEPQSLDPKRIDSEDIRSWMVDLLEKGQAKRSVCRKLSSLKSFYKFLLFVASGRSAGGYNPKNHCSEVGQTVARFLPRR